MPTATSTEPTPPNPETEPLDTAEVVSILKPSVVHIATTDRLEIGPGIQPRRVNAAGTGVVLDNAGNILTNNHLVENAGAIIVTLHSGESFYASLVAGDTRTDTAVIKISPEGIELTAAKLGDSSKLVVGQPVLAIGHVLALPGGPIVTDGIVSAVGVSISADPQLTLIDMVLHTAPINPGNSGGPLVNMLAEVVGINTGVVQEVPGIGFAINVNDAWLVADQIIHFKEIRRGYIGVTPLNVSAELIIQLGIMLPPDVRNGVLVADVREDSAAQLVDMQTGDVIVQINQNAIRNTGELSKFLLSHPPGTSVEITYYRGLEERTASVALGEQP